MWNCGDIGRLLSNFSWFTNLFPSHTALLILSSHPCLSPPLPPRLFKDAAYPVPSCLFASLSFSSPVCRYLFAYRLFCVCRFCNTMLLCIHLSNIWAHEKKKEKRGLFLLLKENSTSRVMTENRPLHKGVKRLIEAGVCVNIQVHMCGILARALTCTTDRINQVRLSRRHIFSCDCACWHRLVFGISLTEEPMRGGSADRSRRDVSNSEKQTNQVNQLDSQREAFFLWRSNAVNDHKKNEIWGHDKSFPSFVSSSLWLCWSDTLIKPDIYWQDLKRLWVKLAASVQSSVLVRSCWQSNKNLNEPADGFKRLLYLWDTGKSHGCLSSFGIVILCYVLPLRSNQAKHTTSHCAHYSSMN